MLFKSPELKAERGYVEAKSYVRNDGSEVLVGRDWTARKKELWERCGGRCEKQVPKGREGKQILELSKKTVVFAHPSYFERCRSEAHDPHHKIPRWPKRDDRLSNLVALCRLHHGLEDERKIGGRQR